ncbi:MAG: T9SS type A sorting domain-containing protein [Bacteroidia bacterium]|nr:T9SS type A sorting domain-containing protein [Bacteroidia bacterium]
MRFLLFVYIVLASFWSLGQERFSKLITSDRNEICQNVVVVDDGYVMCIGSGTDSLDHRCFRLLKTDLSGNILWSKKYGKMWEEWYEGWENALFKTIDGGLALAGTHYPPEGYFYIHSFLMKFNENGDSLWRKCYQFDSSYSIGFHGMQTPDSGYAVCGQIIICTDSAMQDCEYKALLIKTDSDGNMKWYKTYSSGVNAAAVKIVQTSDGGYMLGGQTTFYISGSYDSDMYLVKTDSLGNEQWHKTYGGAYDEFEIKGLITTQDGNVVFTGMNTTYFNSTTFLKKGKAKIFKINNQGGTLWDKEYDFFFDDSPPMDSMYGTLFSIVEINDGSLYGTVIKYDKFDEVNRKMHSRIVKFNSFGDTIWTRNLYYRDYNNWDYHGTLTDIEATPDGGFVLAGCIQHDILFPLQQPWLVKVDSLGDDGTFIKEYKVPEVNAEVYPNPTTGRFYIYIQDNNIEQQNYMYYICNLIGKQVAVGKVVSGESQHIDISEFSSGLYFFSLLKDGKVVYSTKAIKCLNH